MGFTCKGLGSLTGRDERGLFETPFEAESSERVRGMARRLLRENNARKRQAMKRREENERGFGFG